MASRYSCSSAVMAGRARSPVYSLSVVPISVKSLLVRQREHDAAVGPWKMYAYSCSNSLRTTMWLPRDHAWVVACGRRRAAIEKFGHPGPCRVDHEACPQGSFAAVGGTQGRNPFRAIPLQPDACGARPHVGAALECVDGVDDDEARVVDPAVGVLERRVVPRRQRLARGMPAQVDGLRRRQALAWCEVVVQNRPARIIQAGRRCESCGSTKRSAA